MLTDAEGITDPGRAKPPKGAVLFRSHAPQRVVFDVATADPAWLFLSDTWYPGWRAHVSGQEVPVHRANVAGRAVQVPAGRHEVVFEYECAPFRQGWWWVLGAVLVIIALVSPLPQSRGRPAP